MYPMIENQMEKRMENDMETGFMQGFALYHKPSPLGLGFRVVGGPNNGHLWVPYVLGEGPSTIILETPNLEASIFFSIIPK